MEPTKDEFGQPLNEFRYMGEVRGETMKCVKGKCANFNVDSPECENCEHFNLKKV